MAEVHLDTAPPEVVQLDALTAMKIIQHCQSNLPRFVTGQLLGLGIEPRIVSFVFKAFVADVRTTLEVTNCFPFPHAEGDNRGDDEGRNSVARCYDTAHTSVAQAQSIKWR